MGKEVTQWVPTHCRIKGNEMADEIEGVIYYEHSELEDYIPVTARV